MEIPLIGIHEKLVRADENIVNLQSEISLFFQKCKYPVIPKLNDKDFQDALQYHSTLDIPPRFSVLAGEIIHHLRSCLDHIVWALSSDSYRKSSYKFIEFPILEARPARKHTFTSYTRKVKGVTSFRARKLIVKLQPYRGRNPLTDPLYIVHYLDIRDKHRELMMFGTTGYVEAPGRLAFEFARYMHGAKKRKFTPEFRREFDENAKITPQIAFRNFGGRKVQPVIPGLYELGNAVRDVVIMFARL